MYKAKIKVTLKKSIFDPQGKAIQNGLHTLGYNNIESVRMGKYIEAVINNNDKKKIEVEVKEMCEKLLVNYNVETYSFELEEIK